MMTPIVSHAVCDKGQLWFQPSCSTPAAPSTAQERAENADTFGTPKPLTIGEPPFDPSENNISRTLTIPCPVGNSAEMWNPKRLFIPSESLKMVVAARSPDRAEGGEQSAPEWPHDPPGSSGNDPPHPRTRLACPRGVKGFDFSERTARKWLAGCRAEGASGLDNRSSCSKTIANRTAEYCISVIEHLRRDYRLTADEIAGMLRLSRSKTKPVTIGSWSVSAR